MAGKFIQAIKLCKTSNPVILIDEIDKIQKSHRGDPSAALLEALDPSQNTSFLDHYLDIPFDLSKILFIVTANDLSTIPGPLRDRLEIIQLSGYLDEEKLEICKRYLVPKSIASCGLANKEVSITDSALLELIKNYCREPGVRALERHIDKIFRQVAYRIVSDSTVSPDKFTIDAANLEDFVGKPKFAISGYFEKHMVPGVVIGLAWSESGGKALYIESISSKRSGSSGGTLRTTGLMGDSMSESSSIAWTFCKAFVEKHKIKTKLFVSSDVHLHIPEGAVHKNGPSGGVAMVSSLLSLAMDTPVRSDTGMTGEITLNGIILGVGGLKEKCLAAKREGLKRVILPKPNESDILELPENIRKDLEFIFAETYEDVFASIFPSMPRLSTSRNSNISEA